jgi:hypothetical protein
VVHQDSEVVASGMQPGGLLTRRGVEQTEGNGVNVVCRRCRGDLNGGNWVTTEKEMPTLTLKLNRTLHSQFGCALPPFEALRQRIGGQVPQFRTVNLGS